MGVGYIVGYVLCNSYIIISLSIFIEVNKRQTYSIAIDAVFAYIIATIRFNSLVK
jgi:hypothetical protein